MKNELKFAVGDIDNLLSSIWVLKVSKDSIYLMAEDIGNTIKLSLHPKVWRVAYTSESNISIPGNSDRVHEKFYPPKEFKQGWIQAPAVHVLYKHVKTPFKYLGKKETRKINWSIPLAISKKYVFTILIAESTVKESEFDSVLLPQDDLIGTLRLANNKSVLLLRRVMDMSDIEKNEVERFNDLRINYQEVPNDVCAFIQIFGKDIMGNGAIVNIPLGWEHVKEN